MRGPWWGYTSSASSFGKARTALSRRGLRQCGQRQTAQLRHHFSDAR